MCQLVYFATRLETVGNRIQLGTLTKYPWKTKFTSGDKHITTLFLALAVATTLVHLIPGDWAVQFRIGFLIRNVICYPLLNPP